MMLQRLAWLTWVPIIAGALGSVWFAGTLRIISLAIALLGVAAQFAVGILFLRR